MNSKLLHTPVGVRDIYNGECQKKQHLLETVHNVFMSYGYMDIQTPTFEFFDIFSEERGSVASKNLYKFFDREGNTLVLRPDMTPSIARCAVKYYMDEEMPIRLCYSGNAFINNSEYQGKLKEFTQSGLELIGDNTSDADAEVVAMVIETLLKSGLKEFQIEIGQADFFRGLVEESGMDEDTIEELRSLLESKKYFGIDGVLDKSTLSIESKEVFHKFSELVGSIDMIEKAKKLTNNQLSLAALERLEKLYNILKIFGVEKYVSFDLSMLSMYQYYTGIIFKAYTYGTGDAIVTGGRYDNLLMQFGKNSPAIGFAVNIDGLLLAITRQHLNLSVNNNTVMILYSTDYTKEAVLLSKELRYDDVKVMMVRKRSGHEIEEYIEYAKRYNIGNIKVIVDKEMKGITL